MSNKTHSDKTPNKKLKTKRVPAGAKQDRMEVIGKDPEKSYRYVNDTRQGSRLQKFTRGGWEFEDKDGAEVTGNQSEHTKHAQQNQLDVGNGTTAHLMSISKELYEQDRAEKMKEQDRVMDAVNNRALAEGGEGNEYTKYNVKQNKTKVEKHYGKRRPS